MQLSDILFSSSENPSMKCVCWGEGGGISSWRGYVHVVKFIGGIMSAFQNSRGIISTYAKMSGGILSGRDIPFFGCCCELVFSQFYTILVIMSAQCGSRPRRIEHAQSAQIYAPTKASIKEF